MKGKRVVVQGWDDVDLAAACYLALAGARVVGNIDRHGGLVSKEGFTIEQLRAPLLAKNGNTLVAPQMLSFNDVNARICNVGAEVFVPCAASRPVTQRQVDRLVAAGLEVVSSGANVPFVDSEIFDGPTCEHADQRVAVLPDFIANFGMARAFAYLMGREVEISDEAIFGDVSKTIAAALQARHHRSSQHHPIASTAFEIALAQLV